MVPWYAWAGFLVALVSFLAIDLSLHRGSARMPLREAVAWSSVWVAVAIIFGALTWWWRGAETAGQYAAAYLIEWSLSVDNVFVFILIMARFAVAEGDQHRVLFWGVMGAIVMRLGFILGGAALLDRFAWMTFVFGGVLVVTAVRFLRDRGGAPDHPGDRFRWLAGRFATPLVAAIVVVNLSDVVFAVDSIPAVFSVTEDPFVAFTSNALAVLGLRSLFFLLAGAVGALRLLKPALALVLAFIGVKMLASPVYEIPIGISLAVIVTTLGAGVLASLILKPPVRDP